MYKTDLKDPNSFIFVGLFEILSHTYDKNFKYIANKLID